MAVFGNIAHAALHLALLAFSAGDLTPIVGLAVIVSLVVVSSQARQSAELDMEVSL